MVLKYPHEQTFQTWCEGMNRALQFDIEEHESAELNRLLEKFYAEVQNNNGQNSAQSHDCRHSKEKQLPLPIVKDREFPATHRNRSETKTLR